MDYYTLCQPEKLAVRRKTVASMLEDGTLLERFEKAGWLKPIKLASGKGQTDLFAVVHVKAAFSRYMCGEHLPE